MNSQVQVTHSADQTMELASSLARKLRRGDVVALYGELGTGKTQFVRGVCRYFGIQEHITSPTFVLLNRYSGKDESGRELLLFHFDLYRVKSLSEIYDLGYEEFFRGNGICLIEWAEHLAGLLPPQRYDVQFSFGKGDTDRQIYIIHRVPEKEKALSSAS